MTYELIHGDARHVSEHLEPNSVSLIVTSPPYFALRSYQDGGEHYDGQIGSEPTPTEFLDALIACTADWLTVLRDDGSIWVNLGDKYAGSGGNNNSNLGERATMRGPSSYSKAADVPNKSLMGLPWRYALRCIDELGMILRAEVIWSKPNGLPESVTDRVRRSHEQWFHFTKRPRYYAAVDEIREAHTTNRPGVLTWEERRERIDHAARYSDQNGHGGTASMARSPLGKLPGSVWVVPTEALVVPDHLGIDHFAAFPSEWPRRIILGWSPPGICTACGQGRRPVVAKQRDGVRIRSVDHGQAIGSGRVGSGYNKAGGETWHETTATITGYECDCPDTTAPTTPATVLDPFGGTGTTAAVAHHLGRHGVHFDLSRDYLKLAEWRCSSDTRLRDKVLDRTGIVRPADPAIPGQESLFGDVA
jgi:DNA modification methylase